MVQNLFTPKIQQVYAVFIYRKKETCFLQQEFIKVPEQQQQQQLIKDRYILISLKLNAAKCSGSVESVGFPSLVFAIQTKHITAYIVPTTLLSLRNNSTMESVIHLFFYSSSCANRFDPFMDIHTEAK